MKKILNTVVSIIGWVALIAALSSIGFANENPKLAIPLYVLFFLIVFAGVYYFVTRQRHSQENVSKSNFLVSKILGAVLIVAALLMPYFFFSDINIVKEDLKVENIELNTEQNNSELNGIADQDSTDKDSVSYEEAVGVNNEALPDTSDKAPASSGEEEVTQKKDYKFLRTSNILLFIFNALLIIIAFFAVYMINIENGMFLYKVLGYFILIILAAVPAFAATKYFLPYFPRPYDALGSFYWCAMSVAILAWTGISLVAKKK